MCPPELMTMQGQMGHREILKKKSGVGGKSVIFRTCRFIFMSFKLVMVGFMSLLISA